MIVLPYEQGSVEWGIARAGKPTASDFDQIVTPEFKIRTGQMVETYLAKKVSEWWLGGPLPQFNTVDMDLGQILENEAKPWFTLETGLEVKNVGFITTDDGKIGCSPDGLLADGSGIEIKCPSIHVHAGTILNGHLPKDNASQVHGSMFVTGAKSWRFLSYRRRFPPLLLTVERDDSIQEVLKVALDSFLVRLEWAKNKFVELNGGVRPDIYKPSALKAAEQPLSLN